MARYGVMQISEVANGLIDPVLARRAGISTMLLGSWEEIAGADFADCTRPERIAWPRRASQVTDEEGGYAPGVLIVACEGARALFLSHRQGEIVQRINSFFGYPAIDRLRIVQKPVAVEQRRSKTPRPLAGEAARRLDDLVSGIEGEALERALRRLGTAVLGGARR